MHQLSIKGRLDTERFITSVSATYEMPWFRKLRFGRRKSKKTKREISEPTSFQHCYHATLDNASGEFMGLPPQWLGLIGSGTAANEKPPKSPSSSRASSSTVVHVVVPSETRASVGFVVEPPMTTASGGAVVTADAEETERGGSVAGEEGETTPRTASYRSGNSSPVSSVLTTSRESASTTTTASSGGRRVPIIRGSDGCLEETIKYIRTHYRSASSASPASFEDSATTPEEQYVDIHFGSRSRSGSLMQLRGGRASSRTPSNGSPRPSPAAFGSSTHTVGNTSVAPLSSNSAFCMSAPQDLNVVQSDLGLYDCGTTSTSNTTLFRSRIHSPSESSGYFGSTLSSLCSSRISALSSIQQIHATPSSTAATQPNTSTTAQPSSSCTGQSQHRCSALRETSEFPWIHPQMRHGQPHFSSLQRPAKFCRNSPENTPHSATTSRPYPHCNSGSNVANFTGSPPAQYGTNPRAYSHRPRGDSVDSALISRSYREKAAHESTRYPYNRSGCSGGNQTHNTTRSESHSTNLSPYSPSSQPQATTVATTQRSFHPAMRRQQFHQHRRPAMTSEQFRTTLELLVNRSDPRKDYCELAKIGEGSTGVVYLAKEIATGRKVAVKKMNIRRQQRRELLFNEVIKKIFTTNVVGFYILSFYPWLMTTTECSTRCNYMVHWGLFM